MKKAYVVMMTVMMTVGSLAGCGGTAAGSAAGVKEGERKPEESAALQGGETVELIVFDGNHDGDCGHVQRDKT